MQSPPKAKRPSRITVPKRAHPLAKLVFAEMRRQGVTYADLEWGSGVLTSTFKSWRSEKKPGLETIAATLGALGWELVPVPKLSAIPDDVRDHLLDVGQHFESDEQTFGAALLAIATWPHDGARAHRIAPNSLPALAAEGRLAA